MPKTTNLNLEITPITDDTTVNFGDWKQAINGQGDTPETKSNMQLIDDFAGTVNTKLGDIETALTAILGV